MDSKVAADEIYEYKRYSVISPVHTLVVHVNIKLKKNQ